MLQNNLREQYFQQLKKDRQDSTALKNIKLQLLDISQKPFHMYKYCGIDTALKILSSKYVKLQPPDNFNDPFDCLSSIGAWNRETHFSPSHKELLFVKELMRRLPKKFQLPYTIISDLRASYYFAISCFTTDYKNALMWAHYASNHKAVCLEFNIEDFLDQIHPCFYVKQMPTANWQMDNTYLALIKDEAWSYEVEWRYINRTIRPKMRLFGSSSYQIYNQIHMSKNFNSGDAEEWDKINSEIHKELEGIYNEECMLRIMPTRIFLGLNFGDNYNNASTAETIDKIEFIARQNDIPTHRMRAEHNSFNLTDTVIGNFHDLNNPFS
ncbi:DUF2971 domain-containing protein [Mucilaginibacter pedocola]|uniref:DUF2971 domain-containing protein n=1 Tax=Mucilaginibacter pedocola TaxID=1792845 RepID=A0A1S9PBI7_9SPHI|nr:DUF2971 domain-containing protein [Mucilaginibacter pedocola]OOQ57978.1 hypothetical protein BC343_09915 [Mucilaginibacter pedocola]